MFNFDLIVPVEERYGSLSYCVGKTKRVLKLKECVNRLKVCTRKELGVLQTKVKNEQKNENELEETLKDLKEDLAEAIEEHEDLTAKVALAREESFWKYIHKKHVREDLTYVVKVRYVNCIWGNINS